MFVSDQINSIGLQYVVDYSVSGSTNPLWIPNIGYIAYNYLNYENPFFNGVLSGGNISLSGGTEYLLLNGATDQNWRIGFNMSAFTTTNISNYLGIVVGTGSNDGFAIGGTEGNSILELKGSNNVAYFTGNVAIGGSENTAAALTVNSITQGFLPPSMTTTQKNNIESPTAGLMVYDNTLNKLSLFTGSVWETISSS